MGWENSFGLHHLGSHKTIQVTHVTEDITEKAALSDVDVQRTVRADTPEVRL